MKKVGLVMLTLLLMACSDSDDATSTDISELNGIWLLVEQYSDPGDGSGEFTKVNSNKTIEFLKDGIFRSNGRLCDLNATTGPKSSGKYVVNDSLAKFSFDNYLLPEGCNYEDYKVYIHLAGRSLIVSYPCIEGCAQKFRKK